MIYFLKKEYRVKTEKESEVCFLIPSFRFSELHLQIYLKNDDEKKAFLFSKIISTEKMLLRNIF